MTYREIDSTMNCVRILLCILTSLVVCGMAAAQEKPSAALITIAPGDAAYERYGHNMLEIRDPERNIDVVFNWGMFEFGDGFVFNFLQGRLWYWMDEDFTGPDLAIRFYKKQDRTIWRQELNLSPEQVRAMLDQCMSELQAIGKPGPGYRYDYYRDNCSTRVRDAVDRAVGGQLQKQATTLPSEVTYRSDTRRLMAGDLPLYVGLNFVLGHPTDAKLTAWEEMFIPMRLRERLNGLTMIDGAGNRVPFVRRETELHASGHIVERSAPPNFGWVFLVISAVIGGVLVGAGRLANRGTKGGRRLFGALVVVVSLFFGLAGLILSYLWVVTDHASSRPNENILQMGPWSVLLVGLVPLAMRGQSGALKAARIIAAGALSLSILGLILKVLPIMGQANGEIIAMALPIHVGLAWAVWQWRGSMGPKSQVAERSS